MSGKIMYCATPSRLKHLRRKIIRIAKRAGYTPIFPFDVGSYEDLEGNPAIGRPKTLKFMANIMKCCDAVGIFGISDGTMYELFEALASKFSAFNPDKEIRVFYGLDPKWEEEYKIHEKKYGDLFARLSGPHHLFALVGPSAIGKTFWSDQLITRFGEALKKVKNTTTRRQRDEKDGESYVFTTEESFKQGIKNSQFLEWDCYLNNYYGSSLSGIKAVLGKNSGIFAMTPTGVEALYQYRFEINLCVILMVPENVEVLKTNFARRNIINPSEQKKLVRKAAKFTLPPEIPHYIVRITGDTKKDKTQLLSIIEPLIIS